MSDGDASQALERLAAAAAALRQAAKGVGESAVRDPRTAEALRRFAATADRLADLAARLRNERPSAPAPSAREDAGNHLLFLAGDGYELVERAGVPPKQGAIVDVAGRRFVVVKLGASPIHGDRRRCAYLLPD